MVLLTSMVMLSKWTGSNPSYDVTDLSCDAAKLKRKTSEDHYSYVELDEASLSHCREDMVKINSYQSTTEHGKAYVIANIKKKSEEQYNYVEPYHKEDAVKMENNPPSTCSS